MFHWSISLSIGDQVLLNNRKGGMHCKKGVMKATVVRVCETSFLLVSLQKPSSDNGEARSVKFPAFTNFPEVFTLRVPRSKASQVVVPVKVF